MKKETLKKANELASKIETCERNLKKIKYSQSENVEIRESFLVFMGIDSNITIPKNLFRVIGKLIESEYIQDRDKLQKELDEL
jgi:hypothetical protein